MVLWLFPLGGHATLKLNEHDVILLVLKQNLKAIAAGYDPKIAQTLITQVESQFDIFISGQARYNLDRSDKAYIVLGTDNRQVLYEADAKKKFPFGMEGRIFSSNQYYSSNSPFATDPRLFEPRIGFEAKAPFLKNRFGKSDRGEVNLAKANQGVTEQNSLPSWINRYSRPWGFIGA
jgi:hypothetical protein